MFVYWSFYLPGTALSIKKETQFFKKVLFKYFQSQCLLFGHINLTSFSFLLDISVVDS